MGVSIQEQGQAMVQALLLGGAAGMVYDLFRILRVRVPLRLLGSLLDLLFWGLVTGVLFFWSVDAWGGRIRLYGAAGLLVGGAVYFRVLSPGLLKLGYRAADVVTLGCRLALLPMNGAIFLLKKMKIFAKNRFHYGRKWYRINQITEEMAKTDRRRAARQLGGASDANQKGRFSDQARDSWAADLHGNLSAESARPASGPSGGKRRTVRSGGAAGTEKHSAGRRHREQGRP
ncbi:MAG: hypothetical protein E7440_04875 [Ruminococcaceae bacterium]|nr:hypothetical protein [Oscillospiraceae bacterium]